MPGWRLRSSLAASMPSLWKLGGMRMSVTSTCGASRLGPREQARRSRRRCPTTSRSGSSASSARTPSRTITLSSARNTVIAAVPHEPPFQMVATVPTRWAVTRRRGCRPPAAPDRPCPLAPTVRSRPTLARERSVRGPEGGGACGSSRRSRASRGSRRRRSPAGAQGHVRVRHHQLRRSAARRRSTTSTPWRAEGRFRFANRLQAWAEIEHGRIVDAGCSGGGLMGATTVRLAKLRRHVRAGRRSPTCAPTRRVSDTEVTVRADHRRPHRPARAAPGEAPAVPAVPRADRVDDPRAHHPRRRHVELRGARREQVPAPLGLRRTTAASRPRSASPNFKEWYRDAFGKHTPWGDQDSKALVTAVETALERQLSVTIMSGGERPEIRTLKEGEYLVAAGRARRLAVPPPRRRAVGHDRRRGRRRGRARRRARRARRARGRASAPPACRRPPTCGWRSRRPTGSTARRCSQLREHHTPKTQSGIEARKWSRARRAGRRTESTVEWVTSPGAHRHLERQLAEGTPGAGRGVARLRPARRALPAGDQALRRRRSRT